MFGTHIIVSLATLNARPTRDTHVTQLPNKKGGHVTQFPNEEGDRHKGRERPLLGAVPWRRASRAVYMYHVPYI
jgi:hypothetical protein